MPQTLDPYAYPCDGPWLGIPHAWNVLTNLPFLGLGLLGLRRLAREAASPDGRRPWTALWAWVALLAAGSGLYHLYLVPWALAADRVCIAGINAALCWLAWARVAPGRARPGTGLLLLAAFEVPVFAWWTAGLTSLVYGLSQALAAVVVIGLHVKRSRRGPPAPPLAPLLGLAGCYALAKVLELADEAICDATGFVGGHPLKHLAAAAGLAFLLRYMRADLEALRA